MQEFFAIPTRQTRQTAEPGLNGLQAFTSFPKKIRMLGHVAYERAQLLGFLVQEITTAKADVSGRHPSLGLADYHSESVQGASDLVR